MVGTVSRTFEQIADTSTIRYQIPSSRKQKKHANQLSIQGIKLVSRFPVKNAEIPASGKPSGNLETAITSMIVT